MEESKQNSEDTVDRDDHNLTPPPKSCAESSEQEIVFSKSTTSTSSGFPDPVERTETECTTEYLMTEKEIQELDKRLEDVVGRLQKQRDDYEKWEKNLNKRRLLAFGRLTALGRFHRQRMDLYDTMKHYLNGTNTDSKCDDLK